MDNIKSFTSYSCIDSCEGMCKKVFTDIENLSLDEVDLIETYINDKLHGGRNYEYIIKLGELFKELEQKYEKLKKGI
ncbi:hypothetical protein FDA33_01065 [Clostridium botulinum]|uniref:hypothetical protein n=1 Tax=Clostridium sp. ZBS4 TaxID=2949974 RepID=UPI0013F13D7C|nr:hypothetical protein [Clostridium sp. ZBS4]NFH88821.1 hypothetical protein [Clostridium botulinum]NFI16775.1 hypothetical protein [Clostridium botulinum]NFL93305.1 hypothetical protein [Clostridium botulinum]NFN50303.1 hypothetical protein [Clostridium botulinum]NFO25905.1 hypothetical protein [Clostridium botulinum]